MIYFVHFVEIDMQNTNEYLQKKIPIVDASRKSSFPFSIYKIKILFLLFLICTYVGNHDMRIAVISNH